MGGIKEFETAKFHERDVAPCKFDFERTGMVRCAEEHCLLLQLDTQFAVLEDGIRDVAGLIGFVPNHDELRPYRRLSVAPEFLRKAPGPQIDHTVGRREDKSLK